jgi:glutamate synthase domain-containing protein 3
MIEKKEVIDAKGLHYKDVNRKIKEAVARGVKEILLKNVNGQRYIGDGVRGKVKIVIEGVPGNDLAAFMDGPTIIVNSNAQDCVCNTMNDGMVIVYGDAGDVLGYGMRGGKLYIKGDVGYRVGIHMKAYKEKKPILIVGGVARDFLGEYMAGGVLIVLGLNRKNPVVGNFIGTGIHGGVIYVRGKVEKHQVAKEAVFDETTTEDEKMLKTYLKEYCEYFNFNLNEILSEKFTKLVPTTHRPYGKLYAY